MSSDFVISPNLPKSPVSLVAVSGKYPHILKQIADLGITVIAVPPCEHLAAPVSAHADMLIHHLGAERVLLNSYSSALSRALTEAGFALTFAENMLMQDYPNDIALNFLSLGKYLIGRTDKADKALLKNTNATEFISIKQGYAKCSVAVVDENHVITADLGIKKALEKVHKEVLLLEPDGILLDGYGCGFIGGCCGKISADTLLFTGDIAPLAQGDEIREFARNCGVKIVSLPNKCPVDIGSILPLKI